MFILCGLSDLGFPELQLSQAKTISERVISLSRASPVALPGAQFHYFNLNYEVLARVVEVVSQQPFSVYLKTHIFTPLQMFQTLNATTSADAFQGTTNMAQGHLMAFGLPFAYPEMSGYLSGSSGIISTAEDMANYLIFQANSGRFKETKLLKDGQPAAGGFSITLWGIAIALLMFIGVMLAIRSLLYLPKWRQAVRRTPLWQIWVGIGCTFLPAFFLLVLPWLFPLVCVQFWA